MHSIQRSINILTEFRLVKVINTTKNAVEHNCLTFDDCKVILQLVIKSSLTNFINIYYMLNMYTLSLRIECNADLLQVLINK